MENISYIDNYTTTKMRIWGSTSAAATMPHFYY